MSTTTVIRAIRKWWWTVVALAVVGGLSGGLVSLFMTPTYTASAQLIVSYDAPPGAGSSELVQANNFAIQKVYGYQSIATSPRVLDEVIATLGLDTSATELARDVSVTAPLQTPVMQFRASAATGQDAVVLAEAFVQAFTDTVTEIETPSAGGAAPVRIESLQDPEVPDSPSTPDVLVNIAVGIAAGLAAGILWIAAAAAFDRRIHSAASITGSRATAHQRVLGSVPVAPSGAGTTVLLSQPLSAVAESYRTIAATLQRVPGGPLGVIAVAPATPQGSTSALSANVALALKEFGVRVALVDANLRSGTISSSLGLSGPGLAELLGGKASLASSLHDLGGVAVLASGATSDSPAELMSGNGLSTVLSELRGAFDVVIVDTAPVLPLSDTILAASAAEATVVAVSAGRVTDAQLAAASDALTSVGVDVVGVVVMDAPVTGIDADTSTSLYRDLRPARA